MLPFPVPDFSDDTLVCDDDSGDGCGVGAPHAEMVPVPVPDIGDDTLACDDGGGGGDSNGGIPALNEDTCFRHREALCQQRCYFNSFRRSKVSRPPGLNTSQF